MPERVIVEGESVTLVLGPHSLEREQGLVKVVEEARARVVKVDCGKLESVNSYQLGQLLVLRKDLRVMGVSMEMFNLTELTRKTLEATGLTWIENGDEACQQ